MQRDKSSSIRICVGSGVGISILGLVVSFATPYMVFATLTYLLMTTGLLLKKKRRVHVTLMLLAILGDLAIVLSLEVQRHAIDTAIHFKLSALQQSHIGFSTVATLLYFPIVTLGLIRLLAKNKTVKSYVWHKRMGLLGYFFRTLGFVTMFTLLAKQIH